MVYKSSVITFRRFTLTDSPYGNMNISLDTLLTISEVISRDDEATRLANFLGYSVNVVNEFKIFGKRREHSRDISLILLDMWSKRKDASREKLYDLHPRYYLRSVVALMSGTESVKLNR